MRAARRPVRLEELGRCLICRGELTWPAIHFCSSRCSEEWIARAREKEPVLCRGGRYEAGAGSTFHQPGDLYRELCPSVQ